MKHEKRVINRKLGLIGKLSLAELRMRWFKLTGERLSPFATKRSILKRFKRRMKAGGSSTPTVPGCYEKVMIPGTNDYYMRKVL